jgi:hypothetical protein
VVASLNLDVYTALSSLAETLYVIDGRIARALAEYERSPDAAIQSLAATHAEATQLYQTLPVDLARIMEMAR